MKSAPPPQPQSFWNWLFGQRKTQQQPEPPAAPENDPDNPDSTAENQDDNAH